MACDHKQVANQNVQSFGMIKHETFSSCELMPQTIQFTLLAGEDDLLIVPTLHSGIQATKSYPRTFQHSVFYKKKHLCV